MIVEKKSDDMNINNEAIGGGGGGADRESLK